MLYLGVPDSKESQMSVMCALTRKFRLHPALSLDEVVAKCPFHFTGADFYALCSDAILIAMSRQAEQVDKMICKLMPFFTPLTPLTHTGSPLEPNEIQSSSTPYHPTLLSL